MLGRWQATITDEAGDIVPSAYIEVRAEVAGAPLVSLYSDRDGLIAIGNPFQADAEGFAAFHCIGGAYKIRAYALGIERIWRYVPIGTNAERDFGVFFTPRGAWELSTEYSIGDLVSHFRDEGGPYAFVSNVDNNAGNEPQFDSSDVGISDEFWTVVYSGLFTIGEPGSSDVVGTSNTSLAIATGTKIFTIAESDRGWGSGTRLRASSDANPATQWMEGVVTSYSGNTLELFIDLIQGSLTRDDWTINIAGEPGEDGEDGVGGGGGGGDVTVYDTSSGTNTILASLATGWTLHVFKAGFANTGPATFNGDPLLDKDGGALAAGFIQPNVWYLLAHDGSNYYLIMSGSVF